MYDFFNLCLNRSYLKKRTAKSEIHISNIEDEIKVIHQNKTDLETNTNERFTKVSNKFKKNFEDYSEYKEDVKD